jgi:competence protein ComEC
MRTPAASTAARSEKGGPARARSRAATVPLWAALVPLALCALLIAVLAGRPDGRFHLWVLDAGQGDAILLRTPTGHTALIDGGPAATPLLNAVGARLPFWQRDLDLVVLTHPHADHLQGLIEVAAHYSIGRVVQTEFTPTQALESAWLDALKAKHVPIHYASRGDVIAFEGEPALEMRVLSPSTPRATAESRLGGPNNASIVLKVNYGQHGILLESDAQTQAEEEMLARDSALLRSEVLKVGHHGSDTSSSPAFLLAARPRVAVISVGAGNDFGRPAASTLERLRAVGADVYRTDERGEVEIVADPDRLWVRAER